MIRRLALAWVLLYTAGLTEPQKQRRRLEIESDMHEEFAFAVAQGDGAAAFSGSVANRTLRGMLADVLWRLEAGRSGEQAIRAGAEPPLPWFTMWFVVALIVAGCVAATQVGNIVDGRVTLAFVAAAGAGLLWLGLYLTRRRVLGPAFIVVGTLLIVGGTWWTLVVPIAAGLAGVFGVRRAHRLECLLEDH
jgi:drug/metabolite transporter (DMT)-like permease